MGSKEIKALPLLETGIRLRMSRDAVIRRLGTELDGYKDPVTGRWMVTLESIERYLADQKTAAAS